MASEKKLAKSDPSRYTTEYHDGRYLIVDTTTGEVVPSAADEWKAYRDGYTLAYAAEATAQIMNRTGHK